MYTHKIQDNRRNYNQAIAEQEQPKKTTMRLRTSRTRKVVGPKLTLENRPAHQRTLHTVDAGKVVGPKLTLEPRPAHQHTLHTPGHAQSAPIQSHR